MSTNFKQAESQTFKNGKPGTNLSLSTLPTNGKYKNEQSILSGIRQSNPQRSPGQSFSLSPDPFEIAARRYFKNASTQNLFESQKNKNKQAQSMVDTTQYFQSLHTKKLIPQKNEIFDMSNKDHGFLPKMSQNNIANSHMVEIMPQRNKTFKEMRCNYQDNNFTILNKSPSSQTDAQQSSKNAKSSSKNSIQEMNIVISNQDDVSNQSKKHQERLSLQTQQQQHSRGITWSSISPTDISLHSNKSPHQLHIQLQKTQDKLIYRLVVNCMLQCFQIDEITASDVLNACKIQLKILRKTHLISLSESSDVSTLVLDSGKIIRRIFIDEQQSSVFFDLLVSQVQENSFNVINQSCDLRPVFNLILLALQNYQMPITQASALHCLDTLLDCNQGHFRPQIWHWIQYTQPIPQENGIFALISKPPRTPIPDGKMKSFMKSINLLIHKNNLLGELACSVLFKASQKKMLELFLSQLPSLFQSREQYLYMIFDKFSMIKKCLAELFNDESGLSLIVHFETLGIPNFIITQCLCLLDSTISQFNNVQSNFQLSQIKLKAKIDSSSKYSKHQKATHLQNLAVNLIAEVWCSFPQALIGIFRTEEDLQDNSDRSMEIHVLQSNTLKKPKRIIISKVLQSFKRIAVDNDNLALRKKITTKLFLLLESQATVDEHTAKVILKILVFLLVEWHEDQSIRTHLMKNFAFTFNLTFMDLNELVMPLCNIIKINLGQDIDFLNRYLTHKDFKFFNSIVEYQSLNTQSKVALCQIMEKYMLKSKEEHRTVADKIFTQLMKYRCQNASVYHIYLKQHIAQAIQELAFAENASQTISGINYEKEIELQSQLQYLYKHILTLANGSKLKTDTSLQDYTKSTIRSILLRGSVHNQFLNELLAELGDFFQVTPQNQIFPDSKQTPQKAIVKYLMAQSPISRFQSQTKKIESQDVVNEKLGQLNQQTEILLKQIGQIQNKNTKEQINSLDHQHMLTGISMPFNIFHQEPKLSEDFLSHQKQNQSDFGIKEINDKPRNFEKQIEWSALTKNQSHHIKSQSQNTLQDAVKQSTVGVQTIQDNQTQTTYRQLVDQIIIHSSQLENNVQDMQTQTTFVERQDAPPVESPKEDSKTKNRLKNAELNFQLIAKGEPHYLPYYNQWQSLLSPNFEANKKIDGLKQSTLSLQSNPIEATNLFQPSDLSPSPQISPSKFQYHDSSSQRLLGLQLYKTDLGASQEQVPQIKLPDSNYENADVQHQLKFEPLCPQIQYFEFQPLIKEFKQQKTLMIQSNPAIVEVPQPVQSQRAKLKDESPINTRTENESNEKNQKRSSKVQQSYQTTFRTEIFSSETGPTDTKHLQVPSLQQPLLNQQEFYDSSLPTLIHQQYGNHPIRRGDKFKNEQPISENVGMHQSVQQLECSPASQQKQVNEICYHCNNRFNKQTAGHEETQKQQIPVLELDPSGYQIYEQQNLMKQQRLTFNNDPSDISDDQYLQPNHSQFCKEPHHIQRSISRQQNLQNQIVQRSSRNKMTGIIIPMKLPKTNDQWRGQKVGLTMFGDRVIGLGDATNASRSSHDFTRGSPLNYQTKKLVLKKQETNMSENEDDKMRREWMRHSKLLDKQKQLMIKRMNSNQILRKLSNIKSPKKGIQTKQYNLGDQDVAVTIHSSQAHPEVYQTQIGIRLGIENLSMSGTFKNNQRPNTNNTKQELLKLKTQIDDIISLALQTDSTSNENLASARPAMIRQLPEQISEEEKVSVSTNSVKKPQKKITQSLDQDRDTIRTNMETQTPRSPVRNIVVQTDEASMQPKKNSQMQTDYPISLHNMHAQTEKLNKENMETQTDRSVMRNSDVQTDEPLKKRATFHNMNVQTENQDKKIDSVSIATQYETNLVQPSSTIAEKNQLPTEEIILNEKVPVKPIKTEVKIDVDINPELDALAVTKNSLPHQEQPKFQKPDQTEEKGRGLMSIMDQMKTQQLPQEGEDPNILMDTRKKMAIAIKMEIRRGQLTLKQLIDKFYDMEKNDLMMEYDQGLRLQFNYACSLASIIIQDADNGEKCISIEDFIKFMLQKKIKVSKQDIISICEGDSAFDAIRFISFAKLQLLASCGGDRLKLGTRNFKKLMKHMDIPLI